MGEAGAPALDPTGRRHLALAETAAAAPPGAETWLLTDHASAEAMAQALRARLARETMGLRLYLSGSPGFVAALEAVARDAGLGASELRTQETGPRRAYCVHCRTLAEPAAETYACPGCGLRLEVRDQRSGRLSAYLAVTAP